MTGNKTKAIDFAQQRRQRLTGIALMCGAVALFACLDTTAKYLNTKMDPMQITWARYTSALVLTLIVSNPLTHTGLLRTKRLNLQITRSVLLAASSALNFVALRWLQLDEALSIVFTFPFIVAIASGPMLGEWIGWRRWSAICVGFGGVLLITRPGFGGMHPAALISFAATVCYGLYAVITRIVSRVDSNQTSLFYANFVGALVMLESEILHGAGPVNIGQQAGVAQAHPLQRFGRTEVENFLKRRAPPQPVNPVQRG
ncbi:MAG: DMT family transporter, partial [Terriglobales bacterium]